MRTNFAIRISTLTDEELENFVDEWLEQRYKDYVEHQLWRGPHDKGRDVTGYVTAQRMEGAWDNFQCKQICKPLTETSAFVELGKIFMHSAAGAYQLPRGYIFVAPRGVGRKAQEFFAHPERFRQAFLDRWDRDIAKRLVTNQTVSLTEAIAATIRSFDFTQVRWLDATRLAADKACKPLLVKWFDDDPGPAPRGVVPPEVQAAESTYISQLLSLYTARGPGTYQSAIAALESTDYGKHLRDQRVRFFDAAEFDRYYRESTPEDFLDTFQDEIYFGVVDTHSTAHVDGLARLGAVLTQAAKLQPSGPLAKYAGPQVKQGTCHHLANGGRLQWHP